MYVCMVTHSSKSMDQPGKVANPARGQMNKENEYFPVHENVMSRDDLGGGGGFRAGGEWEDCNAGGVWLHRGELFET